MLVEADHSKTLNDVQVSIKKLEREVAAKKALANQLAEMGGLPVPYTDLRRLRPWRLGHARPALAKGQLGRAGGRGVTRATV